MADWQAIKTEYITTQISYRALEKKYGINYKVIADKGKKEGWSQLRSQYKDKTLTNTLDAVSKKQVDRAAKLISVADLLLNKVQSIVEDHPELLVNTQSIKNLSGVLKDIKEIQMIRSDADMREQEARIANLRKQAEKEDDSNTEVIITFGSEEKRKWVE